MFHLFKSQVMISTRFKVFYWCKICVDCIQLLKSINRYIHCIFLHIFIFIFAINLILYEGIDLNAFLFTNRVKKNVLKAACLTRNTSPDIFFNSILISHFKHRILKINLNKYLQV